MAIVRQPEEEKEMVAPSKDILDDLCMRFVLNCPDEELRSFDRRQLAHAIGAVFGRDAVDLSPVRVPTLAIVGKHDTPTPLPCAQAIADAIEGAALVVIPGAGHLTTVEQPATVVEHLRPFFARCVIGQSS